MRDLKDILSLTPKPWKHAGCDFSLARPTVIDLITLTEINARDIPAAKLWAISRHLCSIEGEQLFPTPDDAKACPAALGAAAIAAIEAMYGEGLD